MGLTIYSFKLVQTTKYLNWFKQPNDLHLSYLSNSFILLITTFFSNLEGNMIHSIPDDLNTPFLTSLYVYQHIYSYYSLLILFSNLRGNVITQCPSLDKPFRHPLKSWYVMRHLCIWFILTIILSDLTGNVFTSQCKTFSDFGCNVQVTYYGTLELLEPIKGMHRIILKRIGNTNLVYMEWTLNPQLEW